MCMGANSSKSDGKMSEAHNAMMETTSSDSTASGGSAPARTLLTNNPTTRQTINRMSHGGTGKSDGKFKQRDGSKNRTNVFKGLGRVATSLLKMSPTYQFVSGLSKTYKGN